MDPATGGVCSAIHCMITALNEKNIHNELVCLDSSDAPFISELSFRVHALGYGKGPWRFNPELIPWLTKNMCRFNIVIVHGLWLFPSYAVRKSLQLFRQNHITERTPKIFVMPHGMLDPYFQKAS